MLRTYGFKCTRDALRVLELAASHTRTGDPYGCSLATQLVPAQKSAKCAMVPRHGSSFPCTASAAPKQSAMWHNICSASSPSYTPCVPLQIVKGLFSSQPFTSSAAQGKGSGSSAILGSPLLPIKAHTSAQVAESQRLANVCHSWQASDVPSVAVLTSVSSHSKGMSTKQQGAPDISLLSPRVQSLWDHAHNAHLGSVVVTPGSDWKAYLTCTKCPDGHSHKWQARVADLTHHRGCPFCSGHRMCPHNSLARKAPHLVKDWDTANNTGSPQDYTAGSKHCAHWICQQGHQWQTSINNRFKGKTGCPVCVKAGPRQRLPSLTASTSQVMELWDQKQNQEAGLDPNKLTCGSGKKAHFACNQCSKLKPHQWSARIADVVRGSGCPYCCSQKVCKCNSLKTQRPDLAAEWCYAKNNGTPDDYTARSTKVVWWESAEQGQWQASIASRSYSLPKAT